MHRPTHRNRLARAVRLGVAAGALTLAVVGVAGNVE